MYTTYIALALLAASQTFAVPASIAKRDPSDKSGKSTMQFACDDTTLPQPGGASGQGEGGFGLFSANMKFTDASGKEIDPTGCTAIDGFCTNCLMEGGGLSSPTNVTGCSNPAGGACSLQFQYNGNDFDSEKKQPKCGHTDNGVQAFSNTKVAICFFDV